MGDEKPDKGGEDLDLPSGKGWEKVVRGGLQVVGGAVPFAGGLFSAAAGYWSEQEQRRVDEFLHG